MTSSNPQTTTSATATAHFASSSTNEWYTPTRYANAVREVFHDRIELDPASCEEANRIIGAERYYTIEENGLERSWTSTNLYLNPPYGRLGRRSQAGIWSERLITEYTAGNVQEAILLVNASTSESWFQPLFRYPICFTNHRIRFQGQKGEGPSPTKGSAFVYFGADTRRFAKVFGDLQIGRVVLAMEHMRDMNRAETHEDSP